MPLPDARVIRNIALAVVLGLVVLALMATCAKLNANKASRSAADGTLASGRTQASQDASKVRDGAENAVSDINANVETGTDAIRQADTPAARDDAALRSLCRVNASASPKCRLLDANR